MRVDGVALEYRWFGSPAPQAIVLLHEGLGSVAAWREFPSALRLATGWPVFAYSRQGYGGSDDLSGPRGQDFLHREALSILPGVLAAAGIQAPVLFGHSDGASIALIYAQARPRAVTALILEAPHLFVEDVTIASISALVPQFADGALEGRLARYHRRPAPMFRAWTDIWLDPAFRSWRIDVDRSISSIPALLLQGDSDQYGTVAQLAPIMRHAPQTRMRQFPGCGHAPHRERCDAVLAEVADFLLRLAARRAGPG